MSSKEDTLNLAGSCSLQEESRTSSAADGSQQHEGSEDNQQFLVAPSALRDTGGTTLRNDKKKPPKQALTEEERKMRRILSNRRSARASRDNRRRLLTDLSARIALMTTENASLAKANAEMRAQAQHLQMELKFTLDSLESHQAASATAPPSVRTIPAGWLPQGRFLPQQQLQAPLPYQCQPSRPFTSAISTAHADQHNSRQHLDQHAGLDRSSSLDQTRNLER